MRSPRLYYGWYDQPHQVYRLSLYPPDAPVRPSLRFPKRADLMDVVKRKRGEVMWWPPLTQKQMSESLSGEASMLES
jgi:hypothetical protein